MAIVVGGGKIKGERYLRCGRKRIVEIIKHKSGFWRSVVESMPPVGTKFEPYTKR